MHLRIISRKSPLAMWQAEHVRTRLLHIHPGLQAEITGVTTEADRFLERSLTAMGGKGVFVKELESALLDGKADIAVHSMKDVPVTLPEGLVLPVLLAREDPRDVLISNGHATLLDLPEGARIGTSSLRRRAQLLARRPDLQVMELRGNVGTRLGRLDRGDFAAIILAAAGVLRLGFGARIREYLAQQVMLPAIGQGVLGIECRRDDRRILELIEPLHDASSGICVAAERAFNRRLGGGCLLPIAGTATTAGPLLVMDGFVGAVDGSEILRDTVQGECSAPESLGLALAEKMIERGAARILATLQHGQD